MKKEIKKLPDAHLAEAKKMVLRHRKRKSCNKCYDRGYTGITEDNMIIPCTYCIDNEKVFKEWKEYVDAREDLKELYGDSLEEGNKAEGEQK
jgi:hypothetical protein